MSEAGSARDRKRRLAAGLSATLLDHADEGQRFLGFLSYRRQDGLALARWLRGKITSFKIPKELKDAISKRDESVGGTQNRVFFDMSYQKPNVDFWDEHIAASLCRSRTLILLQTPSVFQTLPGGEANWCEREIETFLKYYGDPSRILVVMGPDAPIEKFPAPLEKISARWDWIDLRFFSQSAITRWRQAGLYDAQVVKVLAKIYDIADGDLPVLNQEFAKARQRVRRALAIAALATIVALSGLTVWAMKERQTALAQRNSALISQSRYLASGADGLVKDGTIRGALALVQAALPGANDGGDRPLVQEAIASAYNAIYSNHERGSLALPEGTTAVSSDAMHGTIVITTKTQLLLRNGFDGAVTQTWPLDFGDTSHISIAPGDKIVALTNADGAVMVRDITDNREILRHAGEGKGTNTHFIKGGSLLVVADAENLHLHLFDVAKGTEIATRNFTPVNKKPGFAYFDADSELMMLVVDAKLLRLSPADLSDQASLPVDDVAEYAMATSQDKATVYVAAAQEQLDGRILEIDAASWTLKRGFSRIAWGAKKLDVSSRWNTLALMGLNGVDFFDLKAGERTSHVATDFFPSGGQFLGGTGNGEYMIYGGSGSIKWISPLLGISHTSFMTTDGAAITGLDPLPDDSGFLSISEKPSVTRWSYKLVASAADYNVPLIINGVDFKMASPFQSSDFLPEKNLAVASYTGNAINRWDIKTGKSTLVKDPIKGEDIPFVAALSDNATAMVTASQKLRVYTDATGTAAPAGEIDAPPMRAMTAVSPTQAFIAAKSGVPEMLDASDPSKLKLTPLPDMAPCPLSGAMNNFAICATSEGAVKVKRISDGKMMLDRKAMPAAFTYISISRDGTRLAIATDDHKLELLQMPEGNVLAKLDLQLDLSGGRLMDAVKAAKLDPKELASVSTGTKHVVKSFDTTAMAFSPDGKQLAIALPFGMIKLLDVATSKMTELPVPRDAQISEMIYSANGALLAVHEFRKTEVLQVYRIATGEQLADISLNEAYKPKIYALPDGHGYLTISETGHVVVNPVFEKDEDFIAYLAREYPDRLTPAQRRAYFLE
ncbi:toll/interleukin-1 receptor domain-containing protein [Aestuariivirga litoralis]|uniref:toll/interleukin-1 receptor domain-containing protein n=1 Tax=Aestuariivirga litoralis TaxID=2650924 RepID=UPI0018C6CEA8|nr:toll/interleukin-1 receptor domain-containing protein [Aestuariivirga litoralis]MBG1233903.1 hypothetical protein [Aestuariivirga litoralis]